LSRLPIRVQRLLATAGRVGDEQGVAVALVGGAVRDLLLGARELDVDLVVEGDGLAFARRFARGLGARVTPHPPFLTARLRTAEGRTVDVATARRERYPAPGSLPQVEAGTLLDDLFRRDFTVNAMALFLNPSRFGLLEDPLGGVEDLRRRALRVLHPLSFVEDPTRAFRAGRFAVRYGLRLTPGGRHLVRQAMTLDVYHPQAFRRLGSELRLLVGEGNPPAVLRTLRGFGALGLVSPPVRPRPRLLSAVQATLTWYARTGGVAGGSALSLYLLGLTQGLADSEVTALLDRLGLSSLKRAMTESRRALPLISRILSRADPRRPSGVTLGLRPFSELSLLWAVACARGRARETLGRYLETLRRVRPELTGDDLRRMRIPPGPLYRRLLDSVLVARLDGRVGSRREEIRLVRQLVKTEPTR
jgi:tRNA nucleotidyltransferase (CCA-adding enzyme)